MILRKTLLINIYKIYVICVFSTIKYCNHSNNLLLLQIVLYRIRKSAIKFERENKMESKYFCAKSNGKLNYWHTILTGFGFMASSIAWAIYDPYITKILNRLLNESAVITSWSAKLNEAFPALASFAEANGEDVGTAAGGITLVHRYNNDL